MKHLLKDFFLPCVKCHNHVTLISCNPPSPPSKTLNVSHNLRLIQQKGLTPAASQDAASHYDRQGLMGLILGGGELLFNLLMLLYGLFLEIPFI